MIAALQVVVHKDVEIEGSGTVAMFAHPSMMVLDIEQGFEQLVWGQASFDQRHGVDEIRLVQSAHWGGAVE